MAVYGRMRMKTVIFQWLHFVSNGICPLTFFSKQSMMKHVNLQQSIKNKWNILESPRASHPLREGGECQRGSANRKERGNPISRVQPCQRKLIVMSLEDGQIWACLPVEGQGPSYGQPFEVAARVRIKQVPEAEGDDGSPSGSAHVLPVFTLCSCFNSVQSGSFLLYSNETGSRSPASATLWH